MPVRKLFYFVMAIAACCWSTICFGQERELNFMNFGSREGLSSNIVNAILKDRYGFMWFATDDGLNKFDGSKFTVYRHNPDDSTSISSNEVIDLYEDREGILWIGTGSGLVQYNRRMDAFVNLTPDRNLTITSITSDPAGNIWYSSYGGLTILNTKTKRLSSFPAKNAVDREAAEHAVLQLFSDSKKRLWIGTNDGLYVHLNKQSSFKRFRHLKNDNSSMVDNLARAIAEDSKGNIWIGTDGGLSMLKPDGKTFVNYRHSPTDKNTLSSNIVYAVSAAPDGSIWVGTEQGLNILNPLTGKVTRVVRNVRNRYSIVGKAVKSIFIDESGIFWVATFRGGVNKYDRNLAFFNLRQSTGFDPQGLSSPVVTSFADIGENTVVVGTDGGGIDLFDMKAGIFKHVKLLQNGDEQGLAVLSLERVGDEVWAGTFLYGLFIYNTKTGKINHVDKGTGPQHIAGSDIFCIRKDNRGNVWLGTNGQGISFFDARSRTFQHLDKSEKGAHYLPTNGYIRAIEEDRNGHIWIGSNGSGIIEYDRESASFKRYNHDENKLPGDNISTICVARNGSVWVGTAEGMAFLDKRRNLFITYSEKNGLANGVIYKILEDDAGNLWVSTNKGISCFNPVSKKFKNYSYYNGLQRSPFVQGAGLKLADGKLFFGGIDGFNYFDPARLRSNKNVPKVVLTDLKVSNRSVAPGEGAEIKENITVAKKIELDYKQNFSLSFAALNYSSPHENRYLYKLEGFDKDWNNIGSATSAVYTNLDPGKYVFKVKARSETGDWITPVTSVVIYVTPPFWRTIYAYLFYVVLILTALWYLRYRGIKKLEAKFALEQERLQVQQLIEQERRESERLHEFDQLKIKFLTNLSHEFRTPISLIMGPVEQLLQVETSSGKSDQLSMIRRNARRLLNLVNQLLDFRNIQDKELRLNAVETDFIAFSRDVAESFRDLSARKQINFQFSSSLKYYFTRFDPEKMERILFNLLSNAFKFTLQGGEVMFKIEREEAAEGLKIKLSDTGIGIEESAQDKIFERFFQSSASSAILNQGSGIGLSITREFVRMHGGTIEVESIAGKGSTFILRFPFKNLVEDAELDEEVLIALNGNQGAPEESSTGKDVDYSQLPVVLLVEDNDDFRFYLKDNLKTYYKIVEASNGKEGWQKALSSHPQIVISDISMPFVSGIELCKKIKSDKRTSHIPVLLLTALTGEDDQLLGLETGANDYMTKPFNFEILNVKIRNLLSLNEKLKNAYSKQIQVLAPDIKIESDNEKLLEKVIQYIDSNLTNPQLSVEDLSRKVGMSRGSLYSKILELTGTTPVEFIRSVKLDKAAVLLEKSDMNVAQVSYSVGFATPNYFARAFKTRFNMLPSEYINLKRHGDKA